MRLEERRDVGVRVRWQCEVCQGHGYVGPRAWAGGPFLDVPEGEVCTTCEGSGYVEWWLALSALRALPARDRLAVLARAVDSLLWAVKGSAGDG